MFQYRKRKSGGQPAYLVLLNELTLWRAVWLALTRRRVFCIPAPTIFSPSTAFLRRIVSWLGKYYAVQDVLDCDPRLTQYRQLRLPRYYDDPFRLAEPWIDRFIGSHHLDACLNDDAMPLRQAACMVFNAYLDPIWYVRWFSLNYRPDEVILVGLDPILSGTYQEIYGAAPSLPSRHPVVTRTWLNFLLAAVAASAVLAQVFRRIRLKPEAPQDVFLGSDFSGHPRDVSVWREIAAEGHEVVVVFRSRKERSADARRAEGFPCTAPGEGQWSFQRAWGECRESWRHLRAIWRVARVFVPKLAFQAYLLPLRRIKIRQLLTRYRFRNFWVRDDYLVDHILRSQELRRVGGKSIGVAHGLPIAATLVPSWRYIDCDTYMVQGLGILRHYGDRWAPWMKVIASGSLGLTRELETRLAAPRPNNIIFQAKPSQGSEPVAALLDALAAAFPDRKIFLQFKRSFRKSFLADVFRQAGRRYPNVVETEENIYELFLRARYLITTPSTIGPEAIQFGLCAFMIDCDCRKSLYFRDFQEFCENSPDELVRRIRGIEDGSYTYRFADYDLMINREGRFLDQFRSELGLRPRPASSEVACNQPCAGS